MKILFDHHLPFQLAHGGVQIQIERTKAPLEALGVEVEFLRWWDDAQRGDVIHFFGRPAAEYIRFAQGHGTKVVMAELLTSTGSRSRLSLAAQRLVTNVCRRVVPATLINKLAWDAYQLVDGIVALTPWEAQLMAYLFGAPLGKVHVVPNGVEETFLNSPPASRGPWLICTATITERKRVLELAEAAVRAKTPVWIVGRAYAESDPYSRRFSELARQQPQWIRYEGAIADRAKLAQAYRQARGFVLLSTMESLSLSALEAAACECPLLLTELPWARMVFGDQARYCPVAPTPVTAKILREFYDAAPALKPPPKPVGWDEVALQLKRIYEDVLRTSR